MRELACKVVVRLTFLWEQLHRHAGNSSTARQDSYHPEVPVRIIARNRSSFIRCQQTDSSAECNNYTVIAPTTR